MEKSVSAHGEQQSHISPLGSSRWLGSLRLAEGEVLDVILELCRSSVFIIDCKAAIRVVNPAAIRLLGYRESWLRGRRLLDLAAEPRDRRRLRAMISQLTGLEHRRVEVRLRSAHGSVVRIALTARRLGALDESSDSIVMVGDPSDSAANVSYVSRRGDNSLITRILKGSAEPVFIMDTRTRVVLDCNAAAETLFRWRRDEFIGGTLLKIFPNKQSFLNMGPRLADLDAASGIFQEDLLLRARSGANISCKVTSICFLGSEGSAEARVVLIRDNSTSPVREEVLARLAHRAAELSDELSALVANEQVDAVHGRCRPGLSIRQAEIMRYVTRGATSKEIAFSLGISESTVKNHLAAMYRKFGAASRLELINNLKKRSLLSW